DVMLFARGAISNVEFPARPAAVVPGIVLEAACSWREVRVHALDATPPRARIVTRVVHHGVQREFLGFNRARHAVLEAAILATRIHLLPPEQIRDEFARLQVIVDKTAGPRERDAMALLSDYVRRAPRPEQSAARCRASRRCSSRSPRGCISACWTCGATWVAASGGAGPPYLRRHRWSKPTRPRGSRPALRGRHLDVRARGLRGRGWTGGARSRRTRRPAARAPRVPARVALRRGGAPGQARARRGPGGGGVRAPPRAGRARRGAGRPSGADAAAAGARRGGPDGFRGRARGGAAHHGRLVRAGPGRRIRARRDAGRGGAAAGVGGRGGGAELVGTGRVRDRG